MMPSAVRSVRADVVPVRLRFAGMTKVAGLLSVVLSLTAVPEAVEGQGFIARANTSRTVWVEFGRGGPSRNGYESARVPVEYHVYACRGISPGAVLVRFGLRPDDASASPAYWYEGEKYEATGRPTVRSALVAATATSPGGEVGSMQREARPDPSMPTDCENGGVNFADLGALSRFTDPTKPAAVAQFLNTVTLSAEAMSEPLRDYNLEQEFAQQHRAAEQAAAEQERAERSAAEREAAEREARERQSSGTPTAADPQGAQTSTGSTASSQADSAASAMTREQAAAAEQAARQEAARRAVEQAQEEARRQQEQQEEMTAAAVEVAGMAARTGGAFGGYYFTGGEVGNSLYKFNELSGMGFGVNFGPMILDLGQLKGTYSEFFMEDYAEENGGDLPESGEVDGMFLHVGLQFQKTWDALRLGMSGGYLYGTTDDTEISSPTMGFVIGYSMLKFRYDVGLGDESTAGYALYLQF